MERLFLRVSPPIRRVRERIEPPPALAPFARVRVPRRRGGAMDGTWFPASGDARGGVLMLHPWLPYGQAYFHRRGRIEALRDAGYDVLTVDMPGFGESPEGFGYWDLEISDAFAFLRSRIGERPMHAWGVSAGGYWAHPVLSHEDGVSGAVFEDVSSHLAQWGNDEKLNEWPARAISRAISPRADAYLDMRLHAPHLSVRAAAYVGGALDASVPPEDVRELARLAGAECLIVDDAKHLEAIKRDPQAVLSLALATFARAEKSSPS